MVRSVGAFEDGSEEEGRGMEKFNKGVSSDGRRGRIFFGWLWS